MKKYQVTPDERRVWPKDLAYMVEHGDTRR